MIASMNEKAAYEPLEGTVISEGRAEIAYTCAGRGRPPLLFVHGAFGNQGHWHHQMAALSARHTVVAVDLAGHGRSTAGHRQAFTMQSFARDVAAVVAHLDSLLKKSALNAIRQASQLLVWQK